MTEPPFLLDAARILAYAVPGPDAARHGFSFVAGGVSVDPRSVSRVAIAQNLVDDAVFLLHCNDDWETVAATPAADPAAARAAAADAYEGIDLPWRTYRELTAEERTEIENTTRFLRELAAGTLDEA